MERSHLLGEFLVKNKVVSADQMLIAIEDQRAQAHELGLMEHMKSYLNEQEIQRVVMRQFEKNETFEEALLDLGFLTQEEIADLPIDEKTYRTPLGQVLLKFNYITKEQLELWLERFENQQFDDDYEQIKLLKAVPVFANLPDHELKKIVPRLRYKYYQAGKIIFKEGFDSDHIYMIESGLVRLSLHSHGSEMELDSMQSGYSFGLPGVLSQRPRMERAVAIMNSRIWTMSGDDVHQVLVENPESALIAARMVSEKVQNLIGSVKEKKTRVHSGNIHVAILTPDAFNIDIINKLVDRMQQEARGNTLLIHSMKLNRWPGAVANNAKQLDRAERRLMHESEQGDRFYGIYLPGVEDLYNEGDEIEGLENLSYWITVESKKYRSVIFLTYPGHIQFRSMMMGVARRSVVFVRDEVPEFVKFCKTNRDRVYLMDNLPESKVLKNYSALKKICPDTLAPNTFKTGADQLDRASGQIARYLVGKTIGIALGGGGARGMAHIGVLQVLEEQGLEFDALSGASAGAMFGATVAYGYSIGEIQDLFRDVAQKKPLSDWSLLPWRSFAKGRRLQRMLKNFFGNMLTYEMKIPYLPVACDMRTGEAIVEKGFPIWKACLASGAAPGLFQPVQHDGLILTDGGIADNVPAAALYDFGVDFIIAVNISVNVLESPFNHRLAFSNIMRSIDIMGYHTVTRHLEFTNVNIEPDISEFSVFDWGRAEEIFERGRVAMEQKVPELRYLLKKLYAVSES